MITIRKQPFESERSVSEQLAIFHNKPLLISFLITILCWTGFMTMYGFIAPIAENIAGYSPNELSFLLFVVGIGLVFGNYFGGISSDKNLDRALLVWPFLLVLSLAAVGIFINSFWLFMISTFLFGIASFGNATPLQMNALKNGNAAPEMAATVNISAFNLANALGGIIGGMAVDSSFGPISAPWVAILIPVIGILFVIIINHRNGNIRLFNAGNNK